MSQRRLDPTAAALSPVELGAEARRSKRSRPVPPPRLSRRPPLPLGGGGWPPHGGEAGPRGHRRLLFFDDDASSSLSPPRRIRDLAASFLLGNPRTEHALLISPAEMGDDSPSWSDSPSWADSHRSVMLEWVDMKENSPDDIVRVPPISIIQYRDLLERAWGWQRLLANIHGTFDWSEYKRYIEEYFHFNVAKVAAGKDALHLAANRCIDTENRIIRSCGRHLSLEALALSSQIQNRAKDLIQSDGEYPAAAAALLCITKEAELMYEFLTCNFEISETVSLSSKVRRSASNLMLYNGPQSAVAAGAMVGVATEAMMILDSVYRGSDSVCMDYFASQTMRRSIAVALSRLEQELACNAGSDTTEKSIGTGGGLDSEGSGSMGNSGKEMDGQDSQKGNEKMNKNLNNQTDSAEGVREGNMEVKAVEGVLEDNMEVKAAGEETLKDFENGLTVARGKESGKAFTDTGDT